jgi:hypothetical protein
MILARKPICEVFAPLTPRAALTPRGMSSLRLSLPFRVLLHRAAANQSPKPHTSCLHRSTSDPRQHQVRPSTTEPQHPPPPGQHRSANMENEERRDTGFDPRDRSLAGLPSDPDTTSLRPAPKHRAQTDTTLMRAVWRRHRSTHDSHPASKTPVYRPTPKRQSPKTRVPTPGTGRQHRSTTDQRPAPWHLRRHTAPKHGDVLLRRRETDFRRRAPRCPSPTASIPIPIHGV